MNINFLSEMADAFSGKSYGIFIKDKSGAERPVLLFDTFEELTFSSKSQVVSNPIESGGQVSDYKYDEPDSISCRGLISRGATAGDIPGMSKKGRIDKIVSQLSEYTSGLYDMTVHTRTASRENFTLTGFSIKESADNFNTLEADMSFEKIRYIASPENAVKSAADSATVKTGINLIKEFL